MRQAVEPQALGLIDDFADLLMDCPEEHLDREIKNIGHIIMLVFKRLQPEFSDTLHYSLPFAFAELLREWMKGPKN